MGIPRIASKLVYEADDSLKRCVVARGESRELAGAVSGCIDWYRRLGKAGDG
jgi:hypothetical protein